MAQALKALLLLLAAIANYLATKPPNPPPSEDDKVKQETYFDKNPRLISTIVRNSVAAYLILECIVLLSPSRSPLHSTLCPISQPATLTDLSTLSVSFLIGITILCCAAALRVWCYNTLGTLFTFEVTIRPDHKLVTTGPYAYVRHPSYTGGMALLTGATVVEFSKHSYIHECRIMSTHVGWVLVAWLGFRCYLWVSTLSRARFEDEALRAAFGPTWEQYKRAVPCRFIPGLV